MIRTKELTRMITDHDIMWFAGIFEGEGSIVRTRCTHRVQIAQKDAWLGQRLKELFGGHLTVHKQTGIHRWAITGAKARGLVMSIYPFLSPRRKEQVKKVLNMECRWQLSGK